ncbi:MAG: FUSC family protein [Campylobacteraceae bacterium]
MLHFFRTQADKKNFIIATYSMPCFVVLYLLGFLTNSMLEVSIATAGAFNVGFGANKRIDEHRYAPMIIALIGMSFSTFLGSYFGTSLPVFLSIAFVLSVNCAIFGYLSQNAWWVILQWCIAFFLASSYPGDFISSLQRTLLVFAGGLLQFFFIVFFLYRFSFHRNKLNLTFFAKLVGNFNAKKQYLTMGLATGITVLIASFVVHVFKINYGYWAYVTILLTLKPNLNNTLLVSGKYLIGTIAGFLIAGCAAYLFGENAYIFSFEAFVCIFLVYAYSNKDYSVFITFMTLAIIFMISSSGMISEKDVALDRVFAVLVGGASSVIAMFVIRYILRKNLPDFIK